MLVDFENWGMEKVKVKVGIAMIYFWSVALFILFPFIWELVWRIWSCFLSIVWKQRQLNYFVGYYNKIMLLIDFTFT